MLASGSWVHHCRICSGLVVASLNPCCVSGFLPPAWHGKTGKPCSAYQSAHSSLREYLSAFIEYHTSSCGMRYVAGRSPISTDLQQESPVTVFPVLWRSRLYDGCIHHVPLMGPN
jgi:hypothetical protein